MAFFLGYNRKYWEERIGRKEEYPLDPGEVTVKWVRVDFFGSGRITVEREEKVVVGQGRLF